MRGLSESFRRWGPLPEPSPKAIVVWYLLEALEVESPICGSLSDAIATCARGSAPPMSTTPSRTTLFCCGPLRRG